MSAPNGCDVYPLRQTPVPRSRQGTLLLFVVMALGCAFPAVTVEAAVPTGCAFTSGTNARKFFTFIPVPTHVNALQGCSNAPTSFTISPAPSAGLSFNTATGTLYGKPTVAAGATTYTITPVNGDGNGTPVTLSVEVADTSAITCGGGATNADGVNADKEGLLSIFVWTQMEKQGWLGQRGLL
jgi:hypothetical protein